MKPIPPHTLHSARGVVWLVEKLLKHEKQIVCVQSYTAEEGVNDVSL